MRTPANDHIRSGTVRSSASRRDRSRPTPAQPREQTAADHLERLLDLGLEGTFPASDPVSISQDKR
jgi:hypothetical protein